MAEKSQFITFAQSLNQLEKLYTAPTSLSYPPLPSYPLSLPFSFAADIQYDGISEDLWKSGVAMNHGYDVSGHNVVILQISKHKKDRDTSRNMMIRKWIAFCYEMHVGDGEGGLRGGKEKGGADKINIYNCKPVPVEIHSLFSY